MRLPPGGARERLVAASVVAMSAILAWLPAMDSPFWGDDFVFLQDAFRARMAHEPWWRPFWPDVRYQFWRPLGHETYWRIVEQWLGSDARRAHVLNFALWSAACASVGAFVAVLASRARWAMPAVTGLMGGAIYGMLALHFTPLHWTSSADSFFVVAFTALGLAFFLRASAGEARHPGGWLLGAVAAQALGLFSKESAAVLPVLMACTAIFASTGRPRRWGLATIVACASLVLAWLLLRPRFVTAAPDEYAMVLGSNVLRNAAALCAWFLNVPREALRMLVVGPVAPAAFWIAAAALPMAAFAWSVREAAAPWLSRTALAALAAFIVVAYAPYFPLRWQCYEYYAGVAAILPAGVAAHAAVTSRRAMLALALLCISSWIAIEGSRSATYPSLLDRARIAEAQLDALAHKDLLEPDLVDGPVAFRADNPHLFYAAGQAGLAWRLGRLPWEAVRRESCGEHPAAPLLEFGDAGIRFLDCAQDDADGAL